MLTIIVLGIVLTAALGAIAWTRARLDTAPLGQMSEQWLAEHRASDSASPGG